MQILGTIDYLTKYIFIVLLGCNHDQLNQRQLKHDVNCGISLKLDGDAILRAPEFVCFSSIHRAWSEVQNEFRSEFPTKKLISESFSIWLKSPNKKCHYPPKDAQGSNLAHFF